MGFTKRVLNDSLVYGIGGTMNRAINYLLVPIHTYAFASASGEYSVVTRMYAYTAIILVFLTFGMESTYFYFVGKTQDDDRKRHIYSTVLTFTGALSLAFSMIVLFFIEPIAILMKYPDHQAYILSLFLCIAFDAFQTIPAAYLRQHDKKKKYIAICICKSLLILMLNGFYFILFPALELFPFGMYGPNGEFDVSYVFYINLVVSFITTFFYWQELSVASIKLDYRLFYSILKYSLPLVILQIAGMIMQHADKVLYPYLDQSIQSEQNLSVYGAVVKIAAVIVLINSFFRMAFDCLALNNTNKESNKSDMASSMKLYVIIMLMAFLGVNAAMNFLRYIIDNDYWSGLHVVPIIMGTLILSGIYQNISMGYKQINKNTWLVCFAIVSCLLFIVLNVAFVPKYGYEACAWAGFASFGVAVVLSYAVSLRITKIEYPVLPLLRYVILALVLSSCMALINEWTNTIIAILPNLLLALIFVYYFIKKDYQTIIND